MYNFNFYFNFTMISVILCQSDACIYNVFSLFSWADGSQAIPALV